MCEGPHAASVSDRARELTITGYRWGSKEIADAPEENTTMRFLVPVTDRLVNGLLFVIDAPSN